MKVKVFETKGIAFRANDREYEYSAEWHYPTLKLDIKPNPLAFTSLNERLAGVRALFDEEMTYNTLEAILNELAYLVAYVDSLKTTYKSLLDFLEEINRRIKQC